MTSKKAAKTIFCEGVHTGRNLWICVQDGVNKRNKNALSGIFVFGDKLKSSIYIPERVYPEDQYVCIGSEE